MASNYFQSYIQVLRRISQIDAEIQREQRVFDAHFERSAALNYPVGQGEPAPVAAAEPRPRTEAPLPGEQPLTLADTELGRRFRGN